MKGVASSSAVKKEDLFFGAKKRDVLGWLLRPLHCSSVVQTRFLPETESRQLLGTVLNSVPFCANPFSDRGRKDREQQQPKILSEGTGSRSVRYFGWQLVLEAGRWLWMKSTSLSSALCHEARMEGHTGLDSPRWPWGQRLVTQHLEPGRHRLLGRGLRDGPDPWHLWLSSLETQLGVAWARLVRQFQVRSLKQDWGKI